MADGSQGPAAPAPPRGNLFTMDLLRAHTKGFTLLFDRAKKNNKMFIKGINLFLFL